MRSHIRNGHSNGNGRTVMQIGQVNFFPQSGSCFFSRAFLESRSYARARDIWEREGQGQICLKEYLMEDGKGIKGIANRIVLLPGS